MKVLDLFSGIGGFSLGLERAGMEAVAFCEINPYCRKVIKKHWPDIPIYNDIRTLKGGEIGTVDLVCGGYPCQPFSVAGKQRGKADHRHLWPEYFRIIREVRPVWVIGENVTGHVNMGIDDVLHDMESEGYAWEAFIIPACAVNAPHRRDRVWIVCHTEHYGLPATEVCGINPEDAGESQERQEQAKQFKGAGQPGSNANVADPGTPRMPSWLPGQEHRQEGNAEKPYYGGDRRTGREVDNHWATEPDVGRVAHGIPDRVDRIRALGNAVVPQIPEILGRAIMAIGGKVSK